MKLITSALFFLGSLVGVTASAALPKFTIVDEPCPKSAYGSITRYSVSSENLQSDIIVDVWTPTGYDPSDTRRYPVLLLFRSIAPLPVWRRPSQWVPAWAHWLLCIFFVNILRYSEVRPVFPPTGLAHSI